MRPITAKWGDWEVSWWRLEFDDHRYAHALDIGDENSGWWDLGGCLALERFREEL